ncbi:MFS transporter [Saccharopolyspora elongata]|uniref:MFS transporter n=1 Tax=Saccharopolyspora elongata TaxID=2530387 RepID=A0A4R4YC32_9PSEU|nr:MFS transporter [Saccharopolyspora elongata]TDD41349.1 MFS transporter [Saccharopolyspora elongata]
MDESVGFQVFHGHTRAWRDRRGHPGQGGARFIGAFAFAYAGFWIACLMPGVVTLALKIQNLFGGEAAAGSLSLVAGAGVLLPFVLMSIVGRMSDRTTARIGMRRPSLLIGAAGVLILGAAMAWAPNIPVLIASYALYSVAANFIGTPLLAVISDRVPVQQRGLVSGLVGLTLPVAMIGGTFVVQLVAPDMLLMFIVPPIIAAISVVVFVSLIGDRRLAKDAPKPRLSLGEIASTFWVNPRRHPDFAWAWISRLLFVTGYGFLTTYQASYLLNHLGSSENEVPQQIFLASLVLSITTILTSVTGGRLSDFLRRRKVFVLTSAAVYGVALIIASLVTGFNGYLLAMGIAGIGYGAFLAVDLALVTDVLPDPDNAGKDMAVFNMSSTLANAIAPRGRSADPPPRRRVVRGPVRRRRQRRDPGRPRHPARTPGPLTSFARENGDRQRHADRPDPDPLPHRLRASAHDDHRRRSAPRRTLAATRASRSSPFRVRPSRGVRWRRSARSTAPSRW